MTTSKLNCAPAMRASVMTVGQIKKMLEDLPDAATVEFWLIRKGRCLGAPLVQLEIGPGFVNSPNRRPNPNLVEIIMGEVNAG